MDKFHQIYKSDFIAAIRELQEESSKLKMHMFGVILRGKSLNVSLVHDYKGYIKDFLKFWEDYGQQCSDVVKTVKCSSQVETIDQQIVKDYLYAKYDYASMLPFVDGMIKGATDGTMKKVSDIEDFFNFTTNKAFDNIGQGVGGCLDNVTSLDKERNFSNNAMFNTLKNVKIIDPKNRLELETSIKNTLKFLFDSSSWNTQEMNNIDDTIKIQIMNYIVEYLSYSVAAYACRIYIISAYFWPFIDNADRAIINKYTKESVGENSLEINNPVIEVMQMADEAKCKDYNNLQFFENQFADFLKAIGAELEQNDEKTVNRYCDGVIFSYKIGHNTSDTFSNQLVGNSIFTMITKLHRDVYGLSTKDFEQMNDLVSGELTGHNQIYFNKDEFFRIIKYTPPKDKSVKSLKELAGDLYKFSMHTLCHLEKAIIQLKDFEKAETSSPTRSPYIASLMSNIYKLLIELYKELAVVVLYKAREIEFEINELNNAQMLNTINAVEIKVPGGEKKINDDILNEDAHLEIMASYGLPEFEFWTMYHEYVKDLLGPEVFTEADQVQQTTWDKIKALIKSVFDSIINFFTGKSFKNAAKWVTNNKEKLSKIKFNMDDEMSITPYKKQISFNYDNLVNNLDKVNIIDGTKESIANWKNSLYPSKEIQELFNNEKISNDEKFLRYKYNLTCDKSTTESYDVNNYKHTIKGDEIHNQMVNIWIPMILSFDKIGDQLNTEKTNIEAAQNRLQKKVEEANNEIKKLKEANTNNNTSQNQSQPQSQSQSQSQDQSKQNNGTTSSNDTPSEPPKVESDAGSSSNNGSSGSNSATTESVYIEDGNNQSTSNNAANSKIDTITENISRIQNITSNAFTNLFSDVASMNIAVAKDIYGYIIAAYKLGKANGGGGESTSDEKKEEKVSRESVDFTESEEDDEYDFSNYDSFEEYVLNEMENDGFFDECFQGYEDYSDISEDIFNEFADLFTESEKVNGIEYKKGMSHTLEDFKKRWKYDKKTETICVEGRYVKLNAPCKDDKLTGGAASIQFFPIFKRLTNEKVEIDGKKIIVGQLNMSPRMFNMEAIYQDAILFHEMGHYIMQMYPKKGMPKSVKDFFQRIVDFFKRLMWKIKARWNYGKDVHGNPGHELEADRFAANRYGNDIMKKSLKNLVDMFESEDLNIYEKNLKNDLKDKSSDVYKRCEKDYESYKKNHKNISFDKFKKDWIKEVLSLKKKSIVKGNESLRKELDNRFAALDNKKLNKKGTYGKMGKNNQKAHKVIDEDSKTTKQEEVKKESYDLLNELI